MRAKSGDSKLGVFDGKDAVQEVGFDVIKEIDPHVLRDRV